MVNLDQSSSNLMQLSDFSVLHEIFHPATTTSIDPKLVLAGQSKAPSYLLQGSPGRKDGSPAPVPLSVHELEQARVEAKPEIATLENAVTGSPHHEGKQSPIDIVHLAAEEIRKPLLKLKDESKVAQTA